MPTRIIRKVGEVPFMQLDDDTKDDVVSALRYLSWRDVRKIEPDLESAILPLVEVNPEVIFNADRPVDKERVEKYVEEWKSGTEFPPVVIDSSKSPFLALVEGGHRTASAVQAKKKRILALDLAGHRLNELDDDRWVYDFQRARRP